MTDYRDIPNPNETVQNRRGYVADTPRSGGNLVWVIVGAAVIAFGALFFLSSGSPSVDPNVTTGSVTKEQPATDNAGTLAIPAQPSVEPAPAAPAAPTAPAQ